jgi:alpha-D-xyloside xylohydrolase
VYGLGEHRTGRVQQAPYQKVFADSLFYGRSSGADVSIPWYCTSSYGFIWNSPSFGSVSISNSSVDWVSNATLTIDFWVTTTPSNPSGTPTGRSPYADLLHQYADAVGHAMPMPFWTTGFIQCKDRYRNQTQLLDVARGYVERGLPISMIVIDWFHWKNMGDWSLNPVCWPDPQKMVDELRSLGIELMITVWPFMGMPYPNGTAASTNWDEFYSKGYLMVDPRVASPKGCGSTAHRQAM